MKLSRFSAVLLLVVSVWALPAMAHKLAPSLLQFDQVAAEGEGALFDVMWKTPLQSATSEPLRPVLPAQCRAQDEAQQERVGSGVLWRFRAHCTGDLTGVDIAVEGMADSGTATLVKLRWLDGRAVQRLLTADDRVFTVPARQSLTEVSAQYTVLGMQHIAEGIDHLLFVLALVMLVPALRSLVWTITSFTIGHSITLSLEVLGYVAFPASLVEWAIALSIFVLAVELSQTREKSLWIARHSWLVAVSFGLLHGTGFASALREIGLPSGDLPLALLSFNIGIELGQLLFIAAVLLAMRFGARFMRASLLPARWAAIYLIGAASAYWTIERGAALLGFLSPV